ncbi:MAG: CNP1-like family protein [Burkholderiales bacterium]
MRWSAICAERPRARGPRRIAGLACLALVLAGCQGVPLLKLGEPERDAEGNLIVWSESKPVYPPYPLAANVVQFEGGNREEGRFYLDKTSIVVGKDGVVRYTLLVLGEGGARTVSYEGIRCETREYRVYGYGRPDRSWSMPLESEWRRINYQYTNNYRAVLGVEYFCKGQAVLPTAAQIVASLVNDAPKVNRRAPYRD